MNLMLEPIPSSPVESQSTEQIETQAKFHKLFMQNTISARQKDNSLRIETGQNCPALFTVDLIRANERALAKKQTIPVLEDETAENFTSCQTPSFRNRVIILPQNSLQTKSHYLLR